MVHGQRGDFGQGGFFSSPRGRGNVGDRAPRVRARGGGHARVSADQRVLADAGLDAAAREHDRVSAAITPSGKIRKDALRERLADRSPT